MRKNYLRHLLILLLCGMAATGRATEGDIINENFKDFGTINLTTTTFNSWKLERCYPRSSSNGYALEMKYHSTYTVYSSAETPSFGELAEGKSAILTFSYARGAASNASSITVTLNNGGSIKDKNASELAKNNKITNNINKNKHNR